MLISCEHIDVLHSALDTKSAPTTVFEQTRDGCPRLRFANRHASRRLGETRWYPPGEGPTLLDLAAKPGLAPWAVALDPLIRGAIDDGKGRYQTLEIPPANAGESNGATRRNLVVNVSPYRDWRGQLDAGAKLGKVAGVVCRVHDQTYLHRVFEAIRELSGAESILDVLDRIRNAAKLLGHVEGHIYRAVYGDDREQPTDLISFSSFGIKDEATRSSFDSGQIPLGPPIDGENRAAWRAIRDGQPVLFCHRPDLIDSADCQSPRGVKAINVAAPEGPNELRKRPNQFWVDFPLLADKSVVGKLTLDWDRHKTQREFELLKVLCAVTSSSLASRQRVELFYDDFVHSFKNHAAAVNGALSNYRTFEENPTNLTLLSDTNGSLELCRDQMLRAIADARGDLFHRKAAFQRVDFYELIRAAFRGNVHHSIRFKQTGTLKMDLDPRMIMEVLKELVLNSRSHRKNEGLKMGVQVKQIPIENSDWVRLVYSDNGPGIPADRKKSIFDRGVSTADGPMRGLGMASVWRIIKDHKGNIFENGTPGRGVRFVIELPRFQNTRT